MRISLAALLTILLMLPIGGGIASVPANDVMIDWPYSTVLAPTDQAESMASVWPVIVPISYNGAPPEISEMSEGEQKMMALLKSVFTDRDVRLLPAARAVSAYRSNKAACIISSDMPLREQEYTSQAIYSSVLRQYRLKGASGPVRRLGDLAGTVVLYKRTPDAPELIYAPSNDDLVAKLHRGRVDAVNLGPSVNEDKAYLAKHSLEERPGFSRVFSVRLHCLRNDLGRQLIERLNRALEATH